MLGFLHLCREYPETMRLILCHDVLYDEMYNYNLENVLANVKGSFSDAGSNDRRIEDRIFKYFFCFLEALHDSGELSYLSRRVSRGVVVVVRRPTLNLKKVHYFGLKKINLRSLAVGIQC